MGRHTLSTFTLSGCAPGSATGSDAQASLITRRRASARRSNFQKSVLQPLADLLIVSAVRWALLLILLNGLVPSAGEMAELVAHYASTGHLPHESSDEQDLGDQGQEHGCGPLAHHCGCCASQQVVVTASVQLERQDRSASLSSEQPNDVAGSPAARLFRPPIA